MAKHNLTGADGEAVAAEFLESKGHKIIARNYRKPYGEIDVVSRERSGLVHFVEVKTVSWETRDSVSRGTYRPEENVHEVKLRRLARVIQAYLVSHETVGDWQFDVIAVYLNQKDKTAKVRWLKNLVL